MKLLRLRPPALLVSWFLCGLAAITSALSIADDRETYRISLAGAKSVEISIGTLSDLAKEARISNQGLRDLVELRLQKAGIRLRPAESPEPFAYLTLNIGMAPIRNVTDPNGGQITLCIFSINLSLLEKASLERNPSQPCVGETWARHNYGAIPLSEARDNILGYVAEMTDGFINDWMAANPNK